LNDVLSKQLYDNRNGNYAYVDDLNEVPKLFVEDLTSTLQVIALAATPALASGVREVQVDFNPDVVADWTLIGYEDRDVTDSCDKAAAWISTTIPSHE